MKEDNMKRVHLNFLVIMLTAVFITSACKTFVVKDVNYSHQIESVLTPSENGTVIDHRHGITYNILPFQYQEFQDSSEVMVDKVRMIRNAEGYYFITANSFRNVYVMEPDKGALKLKKKIKVSEEGLSEPAFNLRSPYVQLIETNTLNTITLNEKGIKKENNKEEGQS